MVCKIFGMVESISSFLVDADEWINMWIKVSGQHRKDCLIENDAIQNWAAAVLEFNDWKQGMVFPHYLHTFPA